MAKQWSCETAEAFINDFFVAGFDDSAALMPRSTFTFLAEVARETKNRPPEGMAKHVILIQWLEEADRLTWVYYLRACSHVEKLRSFIEQKLSWYIKLYEYRIDGAELNSLLKVLALVGEEHWESVLMERDAEQRKIIIR